MNRDPGVWLAATWLIEKYGEQAEVIASKRSADMLVWGDAEERAIWIRIRRAVSERLAPPRGRPN
jgi:hypothetical protein